jgi:hypothetical protein
MRVQSGYVWFKTENSARFFEHGNVHADDVVYFHSPRHCLLIHHEEPGTLIGMIYIYCSQRCN